MEDNKANVDLSQKEAKTQSPPTEVATTKEAEVVVEDSPASNGGDGEAEEEVTKEEVGGESEGGKEEVALKRKRGRPRKAEAQGNMNVNENKELVEGESSASPATSVGQKRGRGRPRGSGRLQVLADLGDFSVNHTLKHMHTHTHTHDIVKTISSFAQSGPRSTCVLSAVGPVSAVDICPAFGSGILRYEGHFELITLSGSYAFTESRGVRRKIGMLSVSLASPDGRIVGGAVAGSLVAGGPVQLILASFRQSIKRHVLNKRLSTESSTVRGTPRDVEKEADGTPVGGSKLVEKNFFATSPCPVPEPIDGAANSAVNDDDQNASQPEQVVNEDNDAVSAI
ncbi:hypothetical protein NMG60_11015605 [Bertholletia excelsa]